MFCYLSSTLQTDGTEPINKNPKDLDDLSVDSVGSSFLHSAQATQKKVLLDLDTCG